MRNVRPSAQNENTIASADDLLMLPQKISAFRDKQAASIANNWNGNIFRVLDYYSCVQKKLQPIRENEATAK